MKFLIEKCFLIYIYIYIYSIFFFCYWKQTCSLTFISRLALNSSISLIVPLLLIVPLPLLLLLPVILPTNRTQASRHSTSWSWQPRWSNSKTAASKPTTRNCAEEFVLLYSAMRSIYKTWACIGHLVQQGRKPWACMAVVYPLRQRVMRVERRRIILPCGGEVEVSAACIIPSTKTNFIMVSSWIGPQLRNLTMPKRPKRNEARQATQVCREQFSQHGAAGRGQLTSRGEITFRATVEIALRCDADEDDSSAWEHVGAQEQCHQTTNDAYALACVYWFTVMYLYEVKNKCDSLIANIWSTCILTSDCLFATAYQLCGCLFAIAY